MGAIGICGSPEQRAQWLPGLGTGEIVGAFGLTEPLSGSDSAQGLRTTAEKRGDTWVLNGEKRWIGNATFSDITIIWAKDVADKQVKGFIVPTNTPGYVATKIERKQSLRIVQNADIVLTDVVIPDSHKLLNANSFADTATVLRLTRAEVAWAAVGIAIGAYEAALAYAKERIQFGRPIASHQLIQDLLVKSLGNITSSLALVQETSECKMPAPNAMSMLLSPKPLPPHGCAKAWPGAARFLAGTESCWITTSPVSLRMPKPSTATRAPAK